MKGTSTCKLRKVVNIYILTSDDMFFIVDLEEMKKAGFFQQGYQNNPLFGNFCHPIFLQNVNSSEFNCMFSLLKLSSCDDESELDKMEQHFKNTIEQGKKKSLTEERLHEVLRFFRVMYDSNMLKKFF